MAADQGPTVTWKRREGMQRFWREHVTRNGWINEYDFMRHGLGIVFSDEKWDANRFQAMCKTQPGRRWISQQHCESGASALRVLIPWSGTCRRHGGHVRRAGEVLEHIHHLCRDNDGVDCLRIRPNPAEQRSATHHDGHAKD